MDKPLTQDHKGFLLIDKPRGITSFDVIRKLRRATGIKKIGHTGTLDPFADGLLICAFGSYTRLCKYLEAEDKSYTAVVKLGESTETGDTEGELAECCEYTPDHIPVEDLTARVLALTELPTPRYSAVKIDGKPAYAYARNGIELDLPKRPVCISSFDIIDYSPPLLKYNCRVSKGTYIRSLSEFIAVSLGTVGHTIELSRVSIGSIGIKDALSLDSVTAHNLALSFYPAQELFSSYECLSMDEGQLQTLRNGQAIEHNGADNSDILLFHQAEVVGVARRQNGLLSPLVNLV